MRLLLLLEERAETTAGKGSAGGKGSTGGWESRGEEAGVGEVWSDSSRAGFRDREGSAARLLR
jgi:hypothetical protein